MAEPGKIQFQTQKPLSEKIKKINSKFRLAEIFSNFFKIFSVQTLKSMGIQCIHMVFEKEKGWEPRFPSQIKFTKAQKCYNSNSTKFYIQVQVQIKFKMADMTCDIWKHVTSCGSTKWFEVPMKG